MLRPATTALLAIVVLLPAAGFAQAQETVVPMGALARAVESLEERTGARTLEIRLADETGAPVFEAVMSREDELSGDDELIYMRLEAPSDDVVEIQIAELPEWMAGWRLHAYAESVEKAKVPLTEAITKAELKHDAPAIGAGVAEPLTGTNAVLAYYVEVLGDRKPDVVAIDAMRGTFIANPEALYARWTPVRLARRLATL